MVTIGCDVDSNALLRYNSTYDKYLADETWANKIFPVCCKGDFEMARSFSGAVCVYAWVEGGTKLLTSNILDVFNCNKQAKILVMNWKAPISEFPHWYEKEDEGCTFDIIGKFRNDAPTAQRDMYVYAKKDMTLHRKRTIKRWEKDDDALSHRLSKIAGEINKIRNSNDPKVKRDYYMNLRPSLSVKCNADKRRACAKSKSFKYI